MEIRKGYETQFNMLQTMICNFNAVCQKEDALKVLRKQKKLIKKHKVQPRILLSMVLIWDAIVQDDSLDESESNDDSLDHLDIDSLIAN